MTRSSLSAGLAALLISYVATQAAPIPYAATQAAPAIRVVAAEKVYGDIAGQIGGEDVAVTSILANPDQDPHLLEASPSVARAVAGASLVVENGIDYDTWMDRLIGSAALPADRVIAVAALVGRHPGDNPHLWYDPATMPALARALRTAYAAADPAHASGYARRLARFEASIAPLRDRIASLRRKLGGIDVTATEPVFGDMLAALGMVSRNQPFQLAVMNGTEVSASEIAAFEGDLRSHRVRLLVVNRQASNAVADRMKAIALAAGVPVVGASETEPAGQDYQAWMTRELDAIEVALAAGVP